MSSSPQQRLTDDIKTALKAGEKERVSTLRLLLTAVRNRGIELGGDVDDDELITLAKRAIKQRREAAEQYRQGERTELAEKEEAEIAFLEPYLPEQVDEATIRSAIEELIAAEGLSGPKAMGRIMKETMARFGGSADGSTVSAIARELLGN